MAWRPTAANAKYGVVVCNFSGDRVNHGLALWVGDTVQILEECQYWYRGFSLRNKPVKGIFPKTFVHLQACEVENPGPFEVSVPLSLPAIAEVSNVLREWGDIWKTLYLQRQTQMFIALKQIMIDLICFRRQMMSDKLTQDQQRELLWKITQKIDWGNSKLGLDVIPRIDGNEVDSNRLSVPQLYKVHLSTRDTVSMALEPTRSMSPQKSGPIHLMMSFKSSMCNVGEEAMVLFSLYTAKGSAYISEKYMVCLSKAGMSRDITRFNKQDVLFADVALPELANNVYLVCQMFREGKLLTDSKKNPSTAIRRPFGCGVAYVGDILTGVDDAEELTEHCLSIHSCNETEFYCIEDYIIKKQSGKLSSSSTASSVCVGLRLFVGDLEKVRQENALHPDVAIANRLGFPEVILPGDLRNDFYVTIDRAEFEKGQKSSGKNVEVSMSVISRDDKVIPDCIYHGVGEAPVTEYHSHVLYHNNSPKWNETVKIQLPVDVFYGSHLRFTLSHCSRHEGKSRLERTFGFSYMRLFQDDGTVIRDGQRSIFIYKNDSSVSFDDCNTYLALPVCSEDLSSQFSTGIVYGGPARNPKECLTLSTVLCSTKLTQNSDLVGLLKWRMKPANLESSLDCVLRVEPEEIVKNLQDVFDALFNILSEKGEAIAMSVMKALYSILAVVMNTKYHRFQSTVETYIQEHFSASLSYRAMVSSLNYLLGNARDPTNREILKCAMKGARLLVMFIIKSQQLHRRSSADFNEEEIRTNLREMFNTCTSMLASSPGALDDVKALTIDSLPLLCSEVLQVFSPTEYAQIIRNCLNAIPQSGHSISTLQVKRLSCIHAVVSTALFREAEPRSLLLPVFVAHLNLHMERKQELLLCFEILADIINVLSESGDENSASGIDHLVRTLLIGILNTFLTIDRKGPLAGLAASCLIGIFKLMGEVHYSNCLEIFKERRDLKDFLTKLFVAFRELIMYEVYPKDWFVLKTVTNNLILTAVQNFSKAFVERFLYNSDFDLQLWTNFFHLSVAFLTQPSLQLETFVATKKDRVLDIYADMRQIMAIEIMNMWETLGDKKSAFIPGMIGPFLEVTLVAETELRKATIPIFFDTMKVEYESTGSFKQVEAELINKLDIFVSNKKGDEEYEELFREIMTTHVMKCTDARLHHKLIKSIESISNLLKRLLDYRSVMNSVDCGMDQKMMCTVSLLEFYNDLQREDMYTRYIQKLCSLHSSCENHTEAGFTLQLHTNLLQWDERIVPSVLSYPEQSEWQRKVQLYIKIINHFDKGKMWEHGIRMGKELAQQYEVRLVDYVKLSDILRTQALFYDNIMTEIRPEPEYFRVAFYGRGFPRYLKDRVFVYRGHEFEKLGSFIQRLMTEFPFAEVLSKNARPDEAVLASPLQYVQCCSVQPITSDRSIFRGRQVDDKISGYYKVNEVDRFTFSRPFYKGPKSENEFSSLWLERTTMLTKSKLPGILRWSEVVSYDTVELSPIETAVDSIRLKNRELVEIMRVLEKEPSRRIHPLSMILNGIIDANVNGGIANYQKAFLSEDYLFLNPDQQHNVNQLQASLQEQVDFLTAGLVMHDRMASAELQPFHENMLTLFERMRHSLETGEEADGLTTSVTPTLSRSTGTLPRSPALSDGGRRTVQSQSSEPDLHRKHAHMSMPQKISNRFSLTSQSNRAMTHAVSSPVVFNPNSPNMRKSSDTSLLGSNAAVSSPSASDNPNNGRPPLPPRCSTMRPSSVGTSPQQGKRYSVSTNPSVTSPPLGNVAGNDISMMPEDLVKSAPALDFIEEKEEAPPILPRKRSAASPSSANARRSLVSTATPPSTRLSYAEPAAEMFAPQSKTLPRFGMAHAHSVGDLLEKTGATPIERRISLNSDNEDEPNKKAEFMRDKPPVKRRPKTALFSKQFATLTRIARKKSDADKKGGEQNNETKKPPGVSERKKKFSKDHSDS